MSDIKMLAEIYNRQGVVKAKQDLHQEALTDFSKAISIAPRLVAAFNNRGASKLALKLRDEAIADFNEALKINPGSFDSYY